MYSLISQSIFIGMNILTGHENSRAAAWFASMISPRSFTANALSEKESSSSVTDVGAVGARSSRRMRSSRIRKDDVMAAATATSIATALRSASASPLGSRAVCRLAPASDVVRNASSSQQDAPSATATPSDSGTKTASSFPAEATFVSEFGFSCNCLICDPE